MWSDSQATDAELVGAFRDGGRDAAFGILVQRYQIPVFRLLLALLAGGDEAEEVCEDVFVGAARDIHELDPPDRFFPWVAQRARELASGPMSSQSVTRSAVTKLQSPPSALRSAVEEALVEMEPAERAVLILAELQRNAPEEIASTLGLPVDKVTELLDRARKRFLASLQDREQAPPSATASPDVGTVIDGRYRLTDRLGQGGMGAVFLADCIDGVHEGERVAVKVLLEQNGPVEEEVQERFRREGLVLARLHHDNLVEALDFGETADGVMYLAMELLEGRSLRELLRDGPIAPSTALSILAHVLRGLEHIHEAGIVHRDIKPANIVLVKRGEDPCFARILDLGIAKLTPQDDGRNPPTLTEANIVLGTPSYVAPEQASAGILDHRVDLYAASVVLFEMVTGRTPFRAPNAAGILAKHIALPPPRLDKIAPDLPLLDDLQLLLDRGLAKKPEQRFSSAQEYRALVEEILASA